MLYIAEKPELARAIVDGLGGGAKRKGYYECGPDRVTWCLGHMLRLYEPDEYNPVYKTHSLDTLPMFFIPWKKRPIPECQNQLAVIVKLLKETDTVVHAGDPDTEGQLLVDEVLHYADFSGRVLRLLINDNNPLVVKKCLGQLRENSDFQGMSEAAEARQVADQAFGINLSRLYSLAARKEGYDGPPLSVGRVQTPILGMIVRRDRENSDHIKSTYYTITALFGNDATQLSATYQNRPDDPQDDKKRLVDAAHAKGIADSLAGKTATVTAFDVQDGSTPPPLPYNLLKLQADAARLYGIEPDTVKSVTQTLREKYRLITYNRSDSQYLSEEQHIDAPDVLAAVSANFPEFEPYFSTIDSTLKSRAFDSSKVTAHHAIIPTQSRVNCDKLTALEQKIYHLIAQRYLVQFMPNQTWQKTTIKLAVGDHEFVHCSRVILNNGWRDFFESDDDAEEFAATSPQALEPGQEIPCIGGQCKEQETKPKPRYSMANLLEDLTRIGQYALDQSLRQTFIEKDKGKAGEHGGIGTPATRDIIVKTLFKRGFIEYQHQGKTKHVVSTDAGQKFYDALPDSTKYPDMTAMWHEQLRQIEKGELDAVIFLQNLFAHIGDEIDRVKKEGLHLEFEVHPCPQCGNPLIKKNGKKGPFWGCSRYPDCHVVLSDDKGVPVQK